MSASGAAAALVVLNSSADAVTRTPRNEGVVWLDDDAPCEPGPMAFATGRRSLPGLAARASQALLRSMIPT